MIISNCLPQSFKNELDDQKCYNIFEFVKARLLPELKKSTSHSSDFESEVEKLEEICVSIESSKEDQSSLPTSENPAWLPCGRPRRAFPDQDQTFQSHNNEVDWTPASNHCKIFPPQDKIFPLPSDDAEWLPSGHKRRALLPQDQTYSDPTNDEEKSRKEARSFPETNNEVEWSPSGRPNQPHLPQDQTYESHSNEPGWKQSTQDRIFPPQDKLFPLPSDDAGWLPAGHPRRNFPLQDQSLSYPSNDEERSRQTVRDILMEKVEKK